MERKKIWVSVDRSGADKVEVDVLTRQDEGTELVGIIINSEGKFYSDHQVIQALYLPELVEYIYTNNPYGDAYSKMANAQEFHNRVNEILNTVGLEASDYYPPTLEVRWIPLDEWFIITGGNAESEEVIVRLSDNWIKPIVN